MAYNRVNWENSPSTNTPVNATSLNIMDEGIEENSNMLNGIKPINNIFIGNIQSKNYWKLEDELRVTRRTSFTNNIPAGTYTISGYITGDDAESSLIQFYDDNENVINSVLLEHNIRNVNSTFQLSSDCTLVRVYTNSTSALSVDKIAIFENMQIEKGTTKTEYTKHRDFTFESGENEYGKWIKYDDGTMICWRNNFNTSVNINTSWGSLYTGKISDTINFPQRFYGNPVVSYNIIPASSTGVIPSNYEAPYIYQDSISNLCVASPVSASSVAVKVDLIAIGRWK